MLEKKEREEERKAKAEGKKVYSSEWRFLDPMMLIDGYDKGLA